MKKILILLILFIAVAGFTLGSASASKTTYHKVGINFKDSFGKNVFLNT